MHIKVILFICVLLVGASLAQRGPARKMNLIIDNVEANFSIEPGCRNGRFIHRASACPITCQTYPQSPRFCTYNLISRCDCHPGYVLPRKDSTHCVRPHECRRFV